MLMISTSEIKISVRLTGKWREATRVAHQAFGLGNNFYFLMHASTGGSEPVKFVRLPGARSGWQSSAKNFDLVPISKLNELSIQNYALNFLNILPRI